MIAEESVLLLTDLDGVTTELGLLANVSMVVSDGTTNYIPGG